MLFSFFQISLSSETTAWYTAFLKSSENRIMVTCPTSDRLMFLFFCFLCLCGLWISPLPELLYSLLRIIFHFIGNLAKNAFEKGVNFTVWKRQGLAISLRLGKRVLAYFTLVYCCLGILYHRLKANLFGCTAIVVFYVLNDLSLVTEKEKIA